MPTFEGGDVYGGGFGGAETGVWGLQILFEEERLRFESLLL